MSRSVIDKLPVIVVTSVIRSADKGQSHGGVYLVDLASGRTKQVIDWNTLDIDWGGRGGDRGLRGIAFHDEQVYLAASDEVLVYDADFNLTSSVGRSAYLKHCHEIAVSNGVLWLTSAGHDSVLGYDLARDRYLVGYELRYKSLGKRMRGLRRRAPDSLARMLPHLRPTFRQFDPNAADGPAYGDTTHINSVTVADDGIFFAGRQLRHLYHVRNGTVREYAVVPEGTHNAQRLDADRIIVNDTLTDSVRVLDRHGKTLITSGVPLYPADELQHAVRAGDSARQAFGRGLAIWNDHYAIAGSSPATVSVHDLRDGSRVAQVNLTMDVRNAVHGLEVWPFESNVFT